MAAGKTTVGRQLAAQLGQRFVDLDQEVERRCGVDIPTVFDFEGEAGFREREAALLDELTQWDGVVLATGGGAVIAEANRQRLRERGFVVYLWAPVDEQLRRTARDRSRPLLETDDRRAKLTELQRTRDPLYREVADCVVATTGSQRARVLAEIRQGIEGQANGPSQPRTHHRPQR